MLRFSAIPWMIGIMVAASGLYFVKYKVQSLHEEVVGVERQLREEKEAVHVLEAEWTYLNRPDRLRRLTARYLPQEGPTDPKQISELEAIPMRDKPRETASNTVSGLTPAKVLLKESAGDER